MRILQVTSTGYVCGGAEKSVVVLRDGLRARGHQVRIMSSDCEPDIPHYSDYECVRIGGPFRFLKHLWSVSAYRTLKLAIRQFRPHVVHFHTLGELSPSVLFALGGTPALLTVHGPEEYTRTVLEWYMRRRVFKGGQVSRDNLTIRGRMHVTFHGNLQRPLYKAGFRRLRLMVSPSRYFAVKLADERYGVPVRQVYNGIVLPAAQPLPEAQNLLYVGRLEHVKGAEVLLRAMPSIVAAVPGVRLRIVGDGPDRHLLETLTRELSLTAAVTFCGWRDEDAVLAEYADARVHVVPSIWPDNLPTVVMEALAVGRPVVGSRVGGIPELIEDGISGAIVESGNAGAFASAIIALLTDSTLAAKAEAARVSAHRFCLDTFITNIENVYGEVLARVDA